MSKLVASIYPKLLTRSCRYPLQAELKDYWEDLKELIRTASPQFYVQLKDLDYETLKSAEPKLLHTVFKYFNRAKYRPTPFGSFAAITAWDVVKQPQTHQRLIDPQMQVKHRLDWSLAQSTGHQATKQLKSKNPKIRCQSTLYQVEACYYFYQRTADTFELSSIDAFPELTHLLHSCREEINYKTLLQKLPQSDLPLYKDLIKQLLELQVLVCEGQPNITGQDYFERIGKGIFPDPSYYSIAHRQSLSGCYDDNEFLPLRAYLIFAQRHFGNRVLDPLEKFKQNFIKRYEQTWQPLATVLDPLLGIGYGQFNVNSSNDLDPLLKSKKKLEAVQRKDDRLHEFLLQQLVKGQTIQLDTYSCESEPDLVSPLSNSIGVLLQPTTKGFLVEAVSSPTGNALLGRFATEQPLESIARDLAQLEQQANPGILIMDVAYQAEGKVDNVNRRPQLYDAEITIDGWSTHSQRVDLKDLLVTVKANQVILFCQKNQKRVVPRIPSAYNTNRSDLPLLHFFAHLQHQGLHQEFRLHLEQEFPGLDHFPRVQFQSLIIHPAKWKIPNFINHKCIRELVKQWLLTSAIPNRVRIGQADQYLTFDLSIAEEYDHFVQYIRTLLGTSIWVEEAFNYPEAIQDPNGNSFAHQIQLMLTHQKSCYQPIHQKVMPGYCRKHAIGHIWLYAILEVPVNQQKEVLLQLVQPLTKKYGHDIEKWFYILYNDPFPQIRFRVQYKTGTTPERRLSIQNEIAEWETISIANGIKSIQFKAYDAEWDRYGFETMGDVESFFYQDSLLALQHYTKYGESAQRTLTWIENLVNHAIENPAERLHFFKTQAQHFATEHEWDQKEFKHINKLYQATDLEEKRISLHQKVQLKIWENICDKSEKRKQWQLLADLIHMHVNRRFPNHPRIQEGLIYQFAWKNAMKMQKVKISVSV